MKLTKLNEQKVQVEKDVEAEVTTDVGVASAEELSKEREENVSKALKSVENVKNAQEVADASGKDDEHKKVVPLRMRIEESKEGVTRKEIKELVTEAKAAGKKYSITRFINEANEKLYKFSKLREAVTDDYIDVYQRMYNKLQVLLNAMRAIVDLYEEDGFTYDVLNNTPGYPSHWQSLDQECLNVETWLEAIEEVMAQQYSMKPLDDKDESLKEKKSVKESWEGENIVNDLIERANDIYAEGSDKEDAIAQAIDNGLIYTSDIIELAKHYGSLDDREVIASYYDELYSDIASGVVDYREDEVDESIKEDKSEKEIEKARHFVKMHNKSEEQK